MASAAVQRSTIQRLSTFKETPQPPSTTATPTPYTPFSPSVSAFNSFSSDPILSTFFSSDFNSTRFSTAALSSGSAASRIEKLQEGLRLLDSQLRHEVLSRHQDLLHQLSSIESADSALSSLQSSVRKVRSELSEPHRLVSTQTLQLSNIHSTTELLQSTIMTLRLSKKLRDLFDSAPDPEKLDLSKAAQLHFEILTLYNESHLAGIDVVDSELKWVVEIGQKLRAEGMRVLERGLEGLNQAEVVAGLQVFYNMGELRGTVDGLMSKYKAMGTKSVNVALDMKAISGNGGGSGGWGAEEWDTSDW